MRGGVGVAFHVSESATSAGSIRLTLVDLARDLLPDKVIAGTLFLSCF